VDGLLPAAARGHGRFVVDMSLTRFCDSSGLQALVAAHRRARTEDGEVLLVIPDVAVLRVFAITSMDRVIPNFASLAEPSPRHLPFRRAWRGPRQAAMTGTRAAPWLTPEKERGTMLRSHRYRPGDGLPGTLRRSCRKRRRRSPWLMTKRCRPTARETRPTRITAGSPFTHAIWHHRRTTTRWLEFARKFYLS
jgi:anti-anti-sigma factor